MRSPGRLLISVTCCWSFSMSLEQPASTSAASAASGRTLRTVADEVIGEATGNAVLGDLRMASGTRGSRLAARRLRLGRGLFLFVQVAIGLRGDVQLQLVGARILAGGGDLDVVQ